MKVNNTYKTGLRRVILIAFLFASLLGFSQQRVYSLQWEKVTELEMLAMDVTDPTVSREVFRTDTNTKWMYFGGQWNNVGAGAGNFFTLDQSNVITSNTVIGDALGDGSIQFIPASKRVVISGGPLATDGNILDIGDGYMNLNGYFNPDIEAAGDNSLTHLGYQNENYSKRRKTEKALTGSTYTLEDDDLFGDVILYNNQTNDVVVTVPSGIGLVNEYVVFAQYNSGQIHVQMAAGVTGVNFSTPDSQSKVTMYESSVVGYTTIGYVLPYTPCTADPNEFHTQANAASDPNCNEADATVGWSAGTAQVGLSSSTDSDTGTYALRGVKNSSGGGAGYISYFFSATAGDTFDVTWRSKKTNGAFSYSTNWQNCTGWTAFNAPGNGVYEDETESITVTTTGNVEIRFYTDSDGSGVGGEDYFADKLSIVHTNP